MPETQRDHQQNLDRVREKEVVGWKMGDLSWSSYEVAVVVAVLGPYLAALIEDNGGSIDILGLAIDDAAFFPYAIALSALVQMVTLPLMGAIADHTRFRKQTILIPAYIASVATFGFFFLTKTNILFGGFIYLFSSVGFGLALVGYNSYLPLLTSPKNRDRVSSGGAAWGYFGAFSYLLITLIIFTLLPDNLGLAARLSLGGSALWCIVFLLIGPQRLLKDRPAAAAKPANVSWGRLGFLSVFRILKDLRTTYPQAAKYLIAYLIFVDAVSAIIALATTFGDQELEIESSTLLLVILMIQLVAIPGAVFFGRLAEWIGTKEALMVNLAAWAIIVFAAFAFMRTVAHYWILGFFLALVIGGARALGRSLFSLMIPESEEARYFGFYQMSASGSSWAAPIIFGVVAQISDSVRLAILPLVAFFIIAIVVLTRVDVETGIAQAKRTELADV